MTESNISNNLTEYIQDDISSLIKNKNRITELSSCKFFFLKKIKLVTKINIKLLKEVSEKFLYNNNKLKEIYLISTINFFY
jgi:hypothetical protein